MNILAGLDTPTAGAVWVAGRSLGAMTAKQRAAIATALANQPKVLLADEREYATLDRAGRVQLPREMTRRLGMRNRVELQEEPDHIGVWPDQGADQERRSARPCCRLSLTRSPLARGAPWPPFRS